MVQNISTTKEGEKAKVKVKVRVNAHGIFSVSTASVVEKVEVEDTEDQFAESSQDVRNQDMYTVEEDVSISVQM